MKIEPMSVEGARNRIKVCYKCSCFTCEKEATAWLTWIHAEARARYWESVNEFGLDAQIAAVKKEVGWPEGE